MSGPLDTLGPRYARLIDAFLATPEESHLAEAYELGRTALAEGVGILELVSLHADLMAERVGRTTRPAFAISTARRLVVELLAPFELAFRGFNEATSRLRSAAAELEGRVASRTSELRAAEKRFRSLVEQIPGITYLAAPVGPRTLTYVGPQIERFLGARAIEILEKPDAWEAQIHPADQARVAELWVTTGAAGEPFAAQYRVLGPQGRTLWVEDQAVLVPGEGTEGAQRQGILLDITEPRLLEEKSRQSQKMELVGQLAGGVAHDFNNLLSVILTYSTLHQNDLPPEHRLREDLSEINLAARRAAVLTRQLLAFSRRGQIEPRRVDLNRVLADMQKMLSRLIGEHIQMTADCAGALAPVTIDPGQLEQVVMNLVVNARDAMPDGGKLRLTTASLKLAAPSGDLPAGEWVELAVEDTGAGMSEEVQARAFEPFFTTKPLGKGTGLGLSTCFGIVEQAGGKIALSSQPGQGTTVRVRLPRAESVSEAAPEVSEAPGAGRGETILVVEDEPAVREATARLLEVLGYKALRAESGAAALALLASAGDTVKLVMTDVIMPGIGGRELAVRLRKSHPKLKIMFASGYADSVVAQSEIKGLGLPLVLKPFTAEELARKLRSVLDG